MIADWDDDFFKLGFDSGEKSRECFFCGTPMLRRFVIWHGLNDSPCLVLHADCAKRLACELIHDARTEEQADKIRVRESLRSIKAKAT